MSRRASLTAIAIGLALLVGLPVAWLAQRGPDRVGSLEVAAAPEDEGGAATAAGANDTPSTLTPSTEDEAAASPSPDASPRPSVDPLAALRPSDDPQPSRVRIPSLGVDAEVVLVGVEDDGEMEIPEDVSTVGWYRWGPAPGDAGSSVIAGHVDSRSQGRGAFFDLRRLQPGDRVEIAYDDGSVTVFEVQGRDVIDKAVIPLDEVFDRDGPARLTLITCGGEFDYGTRHYVSNVVVVATPVDA